MRADRLVATLLLMQARGRVTAAEVADELEVSVATARRDLEALSTAGIPVYPQPGRGGGWSLVGGARTDLTGLTVVRGAGPVPAGRVVVRPVRRRDLRPAQAGPRAAGDVPRGGRGRRSRGGGGPGRVGVRRPVPAAVGRGAAGRGRPSAAGDARLQRARRRVRADRRPVGARRQGRPLVPRRRHARGTPDVPARPDRRPVGARHPGAPARRPRRRRDLGVGGRRGRAAPRARDGDRPDHAVPRAGGPGPVRAARHRPRVRRTTAACGWRSRRTPRGRSPRSSPGSGRRWRCWSPRRSRTSWGAGRGAGGPVCRWSSLACRA